MQNIVGIVMSIIIVLFVAFVLIAPTDTINTILGWARIEINRIVAKVKSLF